jgi:plasmid stabilization system protein ParE
VSRYAVHWSEDAVQDLGAILDFVGRDSPTRARQTLSRIRRLAGRLENLANRGRIVPELAKVDISSYRELIHKPWRIVYRVAGTRVYVVGVLDARRDLEEILIARFR